ncbi:MAG: malto-oligosyltrehalose trehalohydrolase [Deinococcus sp.]|uniref:malto-oligosyltrehalose trehalohydrolase n=1 Tax=Deinococcus sp. TaxID=47478 RepID=UPI0026DD1B8B|nr:malto-oligosyltrehalose trehalohydrolase [Deinococcus sp.]MDO4246917.1 malto-oligosyltrehalose trehalohydrolase [Deinococcus sp.]
MTHIPQPAPTTAHDPRTRLGAHPLPDGSGTRFRLWSSRAQTVAVRVDGTEYTMPSLGSGVYELVLPVGPGARYIFVLDGQAVPDPYARSLPDGVHAEAEVVNLEAYPWQHTGWQGVKLRDCVFYELHIGTFTPEGTYRAAMEKLPYLKELGVTALQIMPLAAFDGGRGWGYDGVAFYAPFAPYGRPEDLMAFVDAAHGLGLGVFLDVVYNHFGPAGNYLTTYSPSYFTDRFSSPWGAGLDFAEVHMRRYVTGNARMWLRDYRFDGLRLDATPAMNDDSPTHILTELAGEVHRLGGTHLLLAEDHRNWPELITQYKLDGIWTDDFHHEVRVTLTGEQEGYYAGYRGGAQALAYTIRRGWRYEGQFWDVKGEEHERGRPSDGLEAPNFVYCIQNHDQIGNRAQGERLHQSDGVTLPKVRGAAALLLTLPMTPLLFQGQEWAASTPFQFFSDHAGDLGHAVTEGRKKEFGSFSGFSGEDVPDPQAEQTFLNSKLNWAERESGECAQTLSLYRELLRLRREDPVLQNRQRENLTTGHDGDVLWVRTVTDRGERLLLWNVGEQTRAAADLSLPFPPPPHLLLHTENRTEPELRAGEAVLLGN